MVKKQPPKKRPRKKPQSGRPQSARPPGAGPRKLSDVPDVPAPYIALRAELLGVIQDMGAGIDREMGNRWQNEQALQESLRIQQLHNFAVRLVINDAVAGVGPHTIEEERDDGAGGLVTVKVVDWDFYAEQVIAMFPAGPEEDLEDPGVGDKNEAPEGGPASPDTFGGVTPPGITDLG